MTRDKVRLQFEFEKGAISVTDLDTGELWHFHNLESWWYKANPGAIVRQLKAAPEPVFKFAAACLELRKGIPQ